jgi:hypothetical protein
MQLSDGQPCLSYPTDTVVPADPIPIFYFHAGASPFCARPDCLCHHYAEQIKSLLQSVVDGQLVFRSVIHGAVAWKEVR